MMITQFSVAMSLYKKDDPNNFDRALESIIDLQTVKPNEIILVVDGPVSDELNNIIDKYTSKYDIIKVIRLPINKGLGNALKIAVENATNELIARMDSDDISLHTRFEEQLNFFKQNAELDIIGGNISEFIDFESNIVAYRNVPQKDLEIKKYLKKRCPFNHVTVMFKKSAVKKAGGYLDLLWNEDYYLWIRMAEQGAVMANNGTVLVNVRIGKEMYKRRGGKKYFASELFLQNYMKNKKMINMKTYIINISKRWIIQMAMPNSLRAIVFRNIARTKHKV